MAEQLKTQGEYLYYRGLNCPGCGSEALVVRGSMQYGTDVSVPIKCESCGLEYNELYTLSGYEVAK